MGYSDDLEIDEMALDREWIKQPRTFMKWSEKAISMRKEVDEAKEQYEVERAKTAHEIRTNPKTFGIDKPTVDAVNEAITIQEND